jgi:hypothetical protein
MIGDDLKLIKKLNSILIKLENSDKEVYLLEAVNLVKTLNNVLRVQEMQAIFLEIINLKYHQSVLFLLRNIDGMNAGVIRKYVQENLEPTDECECEDEIDD